MAAGQQSTHNIHAFFAAEMCFVKCLWPGIGLVRIDQQKRFAGCGFVIGAAVIKTFTRAWCWVSS